MSVGEDNTSVKEILLQLRQAKQILSKILSINKSSVIIVRNKTQILMDQQTKLVLEHGLLHWDGRGGVETALRLLQRQCSSANSSSSHSSNTSSITLVSSVDLSPIMVPDRSVW